MAAEIAALRERAERSEAEVERLNRANERFREEEADYYGTLDALRARLDTATRALRHVADEAEHNSDCALEDREPCDCHVKIAAAALAQIEGKGEK